MLQSDLHIHTLMSGHAFCTANECIENAKTKQLKFIAITDHGPLMEHSVHEGYFEMSKRFPKKHGCLAVLFGCEANIIDTDGTLDISERIQQGLDIVLAGLHERTPYGFHSENDNTKAIVNAILKNRIHIISHPYRDVFPVNIKEIVSAALSQNVLLEINKNVILSAIADDKKNEGKENIKKTAEMVNYLQSAGSGYVINSDAHYIDEIGINTDELSIMTKYLGLNEKNIYNNDFIKLRQFIKSHALENIE
jgi:putative hydrolase